MTRAVLGVMFFANTLVGVLASQTAGGQRPAPIVIAEGPTCGQCQITLEPIARLGNQQGPGMVQEQAWIWAYGADKLIASAPANAGAIQIFDVTGRFLQSFGRDGQGPGEYTRPRVVAQAADTLWIADGGQARLTRIGAGFRVLDTRRLPLRPWSMIRLANGSFIAAAVERSRALFGIPLHVLSREGTEIVRSFGEESETVRVGQAATLSRVLAPAREASTFWAAHVQRYRIERWGSDGELREVLERRVPWFEPWVLSGIAREVRPLPTIEAIREDENGRLWVVIQVAAKNWKPLPPARVEGGMTFTSTAQRNLLHDTIIEVWDLDRKAVHAATRLSGDARILGFAGPGVVYSYSEDASGNPRYQVSRLRLTIPRGGREK